MDLDENNQFKKFCQICVRRAIAMPKMAFSHNKHNLIRIELQSSMLLTIDVSTFQPMGTEYGKVDYINIAVLVKVANRVFGTDIG
jgi:hypothetical protein